MKFNIFGNPQKKLDKKLVEAATKGNVKEVGRLLDAGAEINIAASDVDGPLFMAAYAGDSNAHHQVIELLLSKGAQVDLPNSVGCTPLWVPPTEAISARSNCCWKRAQTAC